MSIKEAPFFVISLDFELFWGMRDVTTISQYGNQILGVREAIPVILSTFQSFEVSATWATVGFVTFENKRDLVAHIPDVLPGYVDHRFDPYSDISQIGDSEKSDPYHYGYSLVRMIQDTPRMEIGSHTFSHFYCLEDRKNKTAFGADLLASKASLERLGVDVNSLVLPRNQYDNKHLADAASTGFKVFRGNEQNSIYAATNASNERLSRRFVRFIDSYVDITGPNYSIPSIDESDFVNVPSSRFLRPAGLGLLEMMRLRRICNAMTSAAMNGNGFHLWWHPHNFGADLKTNITMLTSILAHFRNLQDQYSMVSLSMGDFSIEK